MRGRNHDHGEQSFRFEHLEARQLLSVSPLEQAATNASFVGPYLADAPPQQAEGLQKFAAASVSVPVAESAATLGHPPIVTVDPFVLVAQGFPNNDGTNPAPEDDHYFKGFPSMEILPNGRMISVFAAGTSHGAADTQARWTYSDDHGATWSTPVIMSIIIDGLPISTLSPESIWRIPAGDHAGRLLLSFWNAADSAKSRVAWSDDEGQTWSAGVSAYDPNPTFSTYHYGGHPIQLADGSLLASGYAHVTGDSYYVSSTIRSTDGGQTWSPWSTIASGASIAGDEQPEEPALLLMDNGQILCTVREDTTKTIRTYLNTDGTGASWTPIAGPPSGAFRGYGRPSLVQDDYGTIISITRSATSTFPVFFVSRDHGVTWGPEQDLGQNARFFAYGDMRAVGNGRIALVYGAQSTTNNVRSDVRFTYLNDLLDGDLPPVLDPISNQTVGQGELLNFTAHASDPNLDPFTYSLAAGAPAGATINSVSGAFTWTAVGPIGSQVPVTVVVTQNGTPEYSVSKSLVITILSPVPVAHVTGPSSALRGETQLFSLSATDSAADMTAGFSYQIDWGDGSPLETAPTKTTSVSHAFPAAGLLTVSVTAFDQAGHASAVATTNILVDGVRLRPNAQNPALVDLVWAGSPGADQVQLEQIGNGTTIRVRELMLNGVAVSHTQDYTGVTGRAIAYGQAGNDVLDARGMLSVPVTLNGNAGNNTLYGGSAGDLLIGGSNGGEGRQGNNVIIAGNGDNTIYGNDLTLKTKYVGGDNLIVGGTGRDTVYGNYGANTAGNGGEGGRNLIIGGGGSDTIYASQTMDGAEGGHGSILIAGNTSLNQTALLLVLSEWTSTRTYEQRVANIQGTGTGDRLNGNNFLQVGNTVTSDSSIDELYSDSKGSLNWLLASVSQDLKHRFKPGEIQTDTP